MAEARFHHLSLTCDDPIAVERFYTKHFGFRRARVVDLGGGAQIVFLRGAGTLLELFRAAQPNPLKPSEGDGYPWSGVRNFSFEVDDVDRKLGVAARSGRQPLPDHQGLYGPGEPAAAAAGVIIRRTGVPRTEILERTSRWR